MIKNSTRSGIHSRVLDRRYYGPCPWRNENCIGATNSDYCMGHASRKIFFQPRDSEYPICYKTPEEAERLREQFTLSLANVEQ